ncbi:DUF3373 family protein [Oligoflexia bacterium]|nr:DUF3373 family protein [Oligoflexia bacterium]
MRKKLLFTASILFLFGLTSPAVAGGGSAGSLKKQVEVLTAELEALKARIEASESETGEELTELQTRLDKTELHSATDKISWGIDMRVRGDSIHYKDVATAPEALLGAFFTPVTQGGFNGATPQQIQQAIGQMTMAGMVPPAEKRDFDNDSILTNRLRLNMKAKINENLDFQGRITSYKVFGDSTGVKAYNGLNDVTFDGNSTSLPRGDQLRLERAYFNLKGDWGEVPVNFSLGRRPSTEGPPLEYRNNSLVGGSPLAHIINWQFDGASLAFGLEEVTGLPGFDFKLCYGVGFESGWNNDPSPINGVDDVHMLGFISQLYGDGETSVTMNYAHAFDITDGFAGQTVQPFYVSRNPDGTLSFVPNSGNFISVVNPETEIGDWDAVTLLFTHNASETFGADVDLFLSLAYSHTDPSNVSNIAFYQMMGQGLLSSGGNLDAEDGFSLYTGTVLPVYNGSRFGLEYNYGSKYWFNFTGAEDSLVGSKLAVRGHVFEAYFMQPVYKDYFFVTLGAQFYDYDYTGSGNPLGAPVSISSLTALDALNPVLDQVWNGYLSATVRF